MTAREFFNEKYGETNMGTPVVKFAEEYHKAKVSKMKVDKHLKRGSKVDKQKANIDYCHD